MKYLLYPFSVIYNLVSKLDRYLTKSVKLAKPVISVGNITWGGSGKTPVVIEIAKYILSLGKTPVILSRGYGRKENLPTPVIVRNKEKILGTVSSSGDEPYMMANSVKCPVIVCSDRLKSAQAAEQFNPDIFILDDGFQHWKLERDLDILCVNSLNPFGNSMIIPAGILRENLTALKRAGLIFLTNSDFCKLDKLNDIKKQIKSLSGKEPVEISLDNIKIINMKSALQTEINTIKDKNIIVLCAIGSPSNFKSTVVNLGLSIKKEYIFRDHHIYTYKDLNGIYELLYDDDIIITTAKDYVKINALTPDNIKDKIYVLDISVSCRTCKNVVEEEIKKLLF